MKQKLRKDIGFEWQTIISRVKAEVLALIDGFKVVTVSIASIVVEWLAFPEKHLFLVGKLSILNSLSGWIEVVSLNGESSTKTRSSRRHHFIARQFRCRAADRARSEKRKLTKVLIWASVCLGECAVGIHRTDSMSLTIRTLCVNTETLALF